MPQPPALRVVSRPSRRHICRAGYLDKLDHPYPNLPLYDESLVVLKTHEDKTNYGAFVASLAMPWGQYATDDQPMARGYRYVWARDMYHSVTALRLAGDEQAARDGLAFMDEKLQLPDGSFPQTAFPDGTPNTTGIQLDQTATPILLAWQLKAVDRYQSLVKPAAEFIAKTGPITKQERWEEAGGYSPATLAAEIAALVCAADLATQAGDGVGAAHYLKTADEWNANIEKWTLTTNGPLGKGSYYLRITQGDPNSAEALSIANGGGSHDPREIVDQSFLELVRLGLRQPNDPRILATLEVIDATIEVKTPKGDVYYRYPHDGYGESKLGLAPDGHGNPWPLLIGERSIYEVAQSRSEHPASWYLPVIHRSDGKIRQRGRHVAGAGVPRWHRHRIGHAAGLGARRVHCLHIRRQAGAGAGYAGGGGGAVCEVDWEIGF